MQGLVLRASGVMRHRLCIGRMRCHVRRSPEARCGRAEVDPGDANAAKYLAATRARMQELGIAPRPRAQPDGAGAQPGLSRERASPAAARAGACESPGCRVERGIGSGAVAGLPGSSGSKEQRGGRPLEQTGQGLPGALPSRGRPAGVAAGPSQAPDGGGPAREEGGGGALQAAVPVCPPGEPGNSAARSVQPALSGASQLAAPHRAASRPGYCMPCVRSHVRKLLRQRCERPDGW